MSRTRHHSKLNQTSTATKRKAAVKKQYIESFSAEDFYIELPIATKLKKQIEYFGRKEAWN